jgi:hypothetical protein
MLLSGKPARSSFTDPPAKSGSDGIAWLVSDTDGENLTTAWGPTRDEA